MSINTVELGTKSNSKLNSLDSKLCQANNLLQSISENTPSPVVRTPNRVIIPSSTTGVIPAGYKSFTVTNIGTTDVLLDGVALASGRSNTFTAGNNDILADMSYDTQSSSIELLTIS